MEGVTTHHQHETRIKSKTMEEKNFKLIDRGDEWFELNFDQPNSKANVFTEAALAELDGLVDELRARTDIKGLVVTSTKPGIFIAGADINLIKALDTFDKGILKVLKAFGFTKT